MVVSATSDQIDQIKGNELHPVIQIRKITNNAPSRWLNKGHKVNY